jgi:zinc transporter
MPENGLINAVLLDGKGGGRLLDWPEIESWHPGQGVLWIHLDFTDPGAQDWLTEHSGLEPLVAESLMADETRPRCASLEDGLMLSLRGVNSNPGSDPEDMVSLRLFVTGQRVISTRRRRLLSIRDLIDALQRQEGPRNAGELTAMLADRLIERMSDVINDLEERVDTLEELIEDGAGQEMRGDISELRSETIKLRRYLAPQREALNRLQGEKADWLSGHDRLQIREALDTITRHVEDLDSARDRINVVYEDLSSRLAEQMNNRMYVLSLIAGLFLPLGFLTGLLGINVGGIPLSDNPMGFLGVVVFLSVLLFLQIVLFRRKHWF